jgi:hypothetical protein
MPMANSLKMALRWLFALSLLAWLFRSGKLASLSDLEKLFASPVFFILAICGFAANYVLNFLRWDILLKGAGIKIKFRESFRPFAPSVLEEFSDIYFDLDYPSPFMLNVVKAKEIAKNTVPSVVHVDNTCRVQTVSKINNYHFYNLISEFNKITGVPIVLNTSFNENEPIVLTPQHAFDCFRRTSMDCLVLENWMISR